MAEAASMLQRSLGPIRPLQRVAIALATLTGWRRYLAAFALGALAAAAMPPVDMTPVLLISFCGLVWLADGSRGGVQAFALGWWFGAGFFAAGLYWIGVALLVDWRHFWWLLPVAELGIPAGFGLFTGAALWASDQAGRALHLPPTGRILMLAISWSVFEYLRGHVLTGFPWNLIGYGWSGGFPGSLAMLQASSVVGIYGLSFLTVLAASLPARLGDPAGARIWPALSALAVVVVLAGGGAWRLGESPRADVPGATMRLVQPSIPQTLFNDPTALVANFHRLLGLSRSPGADQVSAVIWPENAGPPFPERDDDARLALAQAAPEHGIVIAGVIRGDAPPAPLVHYWNSLVVENRAGEILGHYDKHHLVPFGEYVPFRAILPIDKITPGTIDFSAGAGPATLDLPNLPPVGPLICYEAIFPGATVDPLHRPDWLLNVTNDAWYGFTSGPFQHLAIARVRAIEQGLPLVRAGNNGVSAMIDPLGRIVARLGLDDVGVLDVPLPRALPPTLYARSGDRGFFALLLVVLALAALCSRYERNRPPTPR
jgi:apolipoprotein N-acyltransferase